MKEYNEGRSSIPSANPHAVYVGSVPGTCQPLPESMPAGFEAQWQQTTIPHGRMPSTTVVGLTGTRCRIVKALQFLDDPPTIDCRVRTPEQLDRVWKEVRAAYGDGFEVRGRQASPHVGSRTLFLRWEGAACEVHEGHATEVIDRERWDTIRTIIQAG